MIGTCACGSVLSAVTWECVRGKHCPTTAKRRADLPLKPTKPQQPCDVGLFGDESSQLDLVDLTRSVGAEHNPRGA